MKPHFFKRQHLCADLRQRQLTRSCDQLPSVYSGIEECRVARMSRKHTAFGRTQLHPENKRRVVDPQSPLKVGDVKDLMKREVSISKLQRKRRSETTT